MLSALLVTVMAHASDEQGPLDSWSEEFQNHLKIWQLCNLCNVYLFLTSSILENTMMGRWYVQYADTVRSDAWLSSSGSGWAFDRRCVSHNRWSSRHEQNSTSRMQTASIEGGVVCQHMPLQMQSLTVTCISGALFSHSVVLMEPNRCIIHKPRTFWLCVVVLQRSN